MNHKLFSEKVRDFLYSLAEENEFGESFVFLHTTLTDPEKAKGEELLAGIKKLTEEEMESRIRRLGAEIVKCSKCQKEMIWLRSKTGGWLPVCLDLINHFADCKFAEEFKKA